MLDDKILERARRLIETRFQERRKILPKEILKIKEEMNFRNALYSGATLQKIHAACAQEVDMRSKVVWDSLKRVHRIIGLPVTDTLASDMKEEINHYIYKITEEISTLMYKQMPCSEQDARRHNLDKEKQDNIQKFDVEVDLYVDSLAVESKNSESVSNGSKMIFISHANEDAALAEAIKTQIDNVFEKKISVFVSSIPGTINPGSDWFDKILSILKENNAFIVLVTPYSEKRPFVWFEIGFSWLRRIKKNCEIYAVCAPPINHGNLPEPLCRLQAISLADEKQTKAFFIELAQQFDLGNLNTLDFSKIQDSLPIYPSRITQSGNIDTRFLEFDNLDGTDKTKISNEAKTILLEAINDENGYILMIRTTNGTSIKTNDRNLIPDDNYRTIAKWVNALDELVDNDFVEERGQNGNGFTVTLKGYEYADTLKKS